MIDNIILLITGTLHQRDTAELLKKCHPLGMLPEMASVSIAQSSADLYKMVLFETPIGRISVPVINRETLVWHRLLESNERPFPAHLCCPSLFLQSAPFFAGCVSEHDLDETNIEVIRNKVYRAYLEAFHAFCKDIGGPTGEVMCEILAVSHSGVVAPSLSLSVVG
jgi:V-type H+-transporting ATPase subunit d